MVPPGGMMPYNMMQQPQAMGYMGVDQHPQAYGHGGMPLPQQPYDMKPDHNPPIEGSSGAGMGVQGPMPGGRNMPPHMQMMPHQQQQYAMPNAQIAKHSFIGGAGQSGHQMRWVLLSADQKAVEVPQEIT